MTTSRLPRRAVIGAVLATSLLGTGLVAAFAEDAGGACPPTYTDPVGDAAPVNPALAAAIGDDDLDLVAVTHAVTGDQFTTTMKVVKLLADGPDTAPGDIFKASFTVAGKVVAMKVVRDFTGSPFAADEVTGSTSVDGTRQTFPTKVVLDVKASTVTASAAVADLAKAVGKDLTGLPFSAMTAETRTEYGFSNSPSPQAPALLFDTATAPATAKYAFGDGCGGPVAAPSTGGSAAPEPSASPSPAPAPSGAPAPAGLPAAGCNTYADAKGDGSTGSQEGAPAGAPNDPDLDITGVVHQTTPTDVTAFIRVDKLAAAPSPGIGHYWLVAFTAKGKAVELVSHRLVEPLQTAYSSAPFTKDTVRIGGTTNSTIKLTATYDTKNSIIKLAADRVALEKALGGPLAGSDLSKMETTSGFHIFTGYEAADVATAKADATFPVDSNACFAPPVPPLSNAGVVGAQYGDLAAVAAKLVDAAGAAVAGKEVTFTLGTSKATGTTGTDGVAKVSLPVKDKAGKRSLVLAAEGATTTVDFAVAVEKTVLKATGGKGAATATLTDDDKKPVAGQVITFTSGSKKVTAKTDAKGVAKASGLPAGNVKVSYPGSAGTYAAASTSTKA